MPKRQAQAVLAGAAILSTWSMPAKAQSSEDLPAREADDLLSADYRRTCMFADAPLNASRYDCLDREYHRLDSHLTQEYRAALARQPDDAARRELERSERQWWLTRFDECKALVADLGGSTAAVIRQDCEIEVLARRTVWLKHY